ncbi:hypothetical protein GCM10010302_16790 [Streptomyces polychromogenes]|uniref:Uncharacterized protein n=1 Tax=Streptomyces polychromogenes TaxID=67342 RepID=A0ABP3EVG6_9ACTN
MGFFGIFRAWLQMGPGEEFVMGKQREPYDEQAAAGRLGIPIAAWRWTAGSGLVPPADAGPGQWSVRWLGVLAPEARTYPCLPNGRDVGCGVG